MIRADLLLTGFREVATFATGAVPRRGAEMSELGRLPNAAIAVDQGRVAFVGPERAVRREVRVRSRGLRWDAEGAVAMPGFVDAHTHLLFAGERSNEIERKQRGQSYSEIARAGGGLYATVRATRAASSKELKRAATDRLGQLVRGGTTSVEVKSGYALNHEGEIRLLEAIPGLARSSGLELVPTYLGAHAIPPESTDRGAAYLDEMIDRTLPEVARRHLARFCDVFCEPEFYTPEQSARLLRAAAALGLGVKVHAEEFQWSGGARLAAELRARSAEHLLRATSVDREALARAEVTAVLLPVTPFASMSGDHSSGRAFVDAGVPVALGSDLSPNSWVESMPVVLAHAVYSGGLTPAEALTAATVNAAHATGLDEMAGQIRVGRAADFAIFDAPDVAQIPYRIGSIPVRVYRQGKLVSSA